MSNQSGASKRIVLGRDYTYLDRTNLNTPLFIANASYLPDWNLQCAMRELLTNLIDQCRFVADQYISGRLVPEQVDLKFVEHSDKFEVYGGDILLGEVTWKKKKYMYVSEDELFGVIKATAKDGHKEKVDTYAVELINYYSRLPYKSFRMGQSTKRDSRGMIGTHGEGLSAACIVLKRHDCNITATTNSYTAKIRKIHGEIYYQLQKRSPPSNGKNEHPDEVKFRIVFEPPGDKFEVDSVMKSIRLSNTVPRVTTKLGDLLTAPADAGKQYNRSIFVAQTTDCLFGYNFADPEKKLLKGRDRNHHVQDLVLEECGRILSEAIIADASVRDRVIEALVVSPNKRTEQGNDNSGSSSSNRNGEYILFNDLQKGTHIDKAARESLRNHHTGQTGIYCTQSSTVLNLVAKAQKMTIVSSHPLLHNDDTVLDEFYDHIAQHAAPLPEGSVLLRHYAAIVEMLGVETLQQSLYELPSKMVGFWKFKNCMYVTSLKRLEDEEISLEMEVKLHTTLDGCDVGLEEIISIIRLLRGDDDEDDEDGFDDDDNNEGAFAQLEKEQEEEEEGLNWDNLDDGSGLDDEAEFQPPPCNSAAKRSRNSAGDNITSTAADALGATTKKSRTSRSSLNGTNMDDSGISPLTSRGNSPLTMPRVRLPVVAAPSINRGIAEPPAGPELSASAAAAAAASAGVVPFTSPTSTGTLAADNQPATTAANNADGGGSDDEEDDEDEEDGVAATIRNSLISRDVYLNTNTNDDTHNSKNDDDNTLVLPPPTSLTLPPPTSASSSSPSALLPVTLVSSSSSSSALASSGGTIAGVVFHEVGVHKNTGIWIYSEIEASQLPMQEVQDILFTLDSFFPDKGASCRLRALGRLVNIIVFKASERGEAERRQRRLEALDGRELSRSLLPATASHAAATSTSGSSNALHNGHSVIPEELETAYVIQRKRQQAPQAPPQLRDGLQPAGIATSTAATSTAMAISSTTAAAYDASSHEACICIDVNAIARKRDFCAFLQSQLQVLNLPRIAF
mmetsp:Transcript_19001/g.31796  ORF Transcript_19001/g.31796 Transcript_19001/m.31796 type:complete len:1019 (+) Transcript_19001:110-3166(+)